MRIDWKTLSIVERRAMLEALIDAQTLAETLDDIGQICGYKALHVQENWQDSGLADRWERAGIQVDAARYFAQSHKL
jgi:hypothetical protein